MMLRLISSSVAMLLALPLPAKAQVSASVMRADGALVPLRIYAPASRSTCAPTLLISHGFGGSETGLSSLAAAAAARGWRVLAMGHRESGRDQLRAAFQQGGGLAAVDTSARERPKHVARFADLEAAYAEALRPCRPPLLVLAGHSMGSQTVMMEAGARPLIGAMGRNRFNGYIALSPQGVGTTYGPGAWNGVNKPVLMVTGTRDAVVDGDYTARLSAFEGLAPGNKRLAVIEGAGHLQIGGIGSSTVNSAVNALAMGFLDQLLTGVKAPLTLSGVSITDK